MRVILIMIIRVLTAILITVLMVACNTIKPMFETPDVTITSFRVLPSNSVNPNFEIGLHVVNPNRTALSLQGMAYNATINGHKILTGANNNLPIIAAYGEGDVVVTATADLFNAMRLLSAVMQQPRNDFNYELNVKLDVGTFISPITVVKEGVIQIAP